MADLKAIHDHYYIGGVDNKGNLKQVWGDDALTNAVKIWLSLSQGELLRRPLDGGTLVRLLTKPMSEQRQIDIQREITRTLTQEFSPSLSEVEVNVVPDYLNRKWDISITAYCYAVKDSLDFNFSVRNLA